MDNKMILCIDGSHLAYRSYHTFSTFSNSSGYPTGMIFGFLSILNSYSNKFNNRIIVLWDTKPYLRSSKYSNYKAHREEEDKDPAISKGFYDIKNFLTSLGVIQISKSGYEADDLIAFITRRFYKDICIISGDKDLLQLVSDERNISMLRPHPTKGLVPYTEKSIIDSYGVHPSKIVQYLSVLGDKSDDIVGINGIGKVKAPKLVNGCDNFNAYIKEVYPQDWERVKLNLELIDLINSPISLENLEESDITFSKGNLYEVNNLLHTYEIRTLSSRDLLQNLNGFNFSTELMNNLVYYKRAGRF